MGLPEIQFIDDKQNKPIAIQERIGLRPIIAVGNSDGDYEMLLWTTAGKGPRFGMLIHHTDADREVAYDRHSRLSVAWTRPWIKRRPRGGQWWI